MVHTSGRSDRSDPRFMIYLLQERWAPDLYDLVVPRGSGIICVIQHVLPALDLYYPDAAQHIITAG